MSAMWILRSMCLALACVTATAHAQSKSAKPIAINPNLCVVGGCGFELVFFSGGGFDSFG